MCIDFFILQDADHFVEYQVLPKVYNLEAYTGNSEIYIISTDGYRFKVELVKPRYGLWYLTGPKWTAFCNRNLNEDVHMLHFVEEGDDCFYVTGYLRNGQEVGGYAKNRATYSRFKIVVLLDPRLPQSIPAELLPEFDELDELTIQANGEHFQCQVQRVAVIGNTGTYVYRLLGEVWNTLVEAIGLEAGTTCVLTKNRRHSLWLDAFHDDGSMITQGVFKGAATLRKVQLPLEWHEEKDDRMKHICYWPFHTDHFRENNRSFYKSYAQIQCYNRLAIPANFLDKHPMHIYNKALVIHQHYREVMRVQMEPHRQTPNRTNHVNIFGQRKMLAEACRFPYTKVIDVSCVVQVLKIYKINLSNSLINTYEQVYSSVVVKVGKLRSSQGNCGLGL